MNSVTVLDDGTDNEAASLRLCVRGCSRSRAARFRAAQFRTAQYRAERFSAAAGCLLASLTSDQRNSAMLGHTRPCVFCCEYT